MKNFITVLAIAAGLAVTAQAGPRGKALKARPRAAAKALKLTDAQKEQAKTVAKSTRQSMQTLRPQLKENREALQAAIQSGNAAQIQALSQKQGELMGKAAAFRNEGRAQVYSTLTSEQREKLEARRKARKSKAL